MRRGLALSAAASLGAYQIGALRYLVGERQMAFDVLAGTGIGAMNAAVVACAGLTHLERFWDGIGWGRLVRPNLRAPWRGPCVGTPQRRFIAAHVSEARLRASGVTLVVQVLDIGSGSVRSLTYPGADVPLIDGLMAAVATPGLCPPILSDGRLLAEATFIDSVPLRAFADVAVDEVIAILPALPAVPPASSALAGTVPVPRYGNWRSVLARTLAANQTHDVRAALARAGAVSASARAHRYLDQHVAERVAGRINDPVRAAEILGRLTRIYQTSEMARLSASAPEVTPIVPSEEIPFPLWRFRREELAWAMALGEQDARKSITAARESP